MRAAIVFLVGSAMMLGWIPVGFAPKVKNGVEVGGYDYIYLQSVRRAA